VTAGAYYNVNTALSTGNYRVSVTLDPVTAATGLSVLARYTSASGACYAFTYSALYGLAILQLYNGTTGTNIGSPYAYGASVGDVFTLEVNGPNIVGLINGVVVCSAADTTVTAAGYAGILNAAGTTSGCLAGTFLVTNTGIYRSAAMTPN
jgi:hypothetical protein